jgi:hypothetical protein
MLEHKCEVCGRMWRKKLIADGKVVCNKHYKQFKKFGFFRDTSSRTQRDKNNITIDGDVAYIDLYDKQYNVIAKAIIDATDVDKIKNIKWRLNHNGYVVNNSHTSIFLHRRILGVETMVDHKNNNRLDNRKSNLRITTQSTNQMNVKYSGVYPHNDKWIAKIKLNQKQVHLGVFAYEEEAKYARWFAEQILFKEFAYPKAEPDIIESRKKEIQELVKNKVQRLQ